MGPVVDCLTLVHVCLTLPHLDLRETGFLSEFCFFNSIDLPVFLT
jgi:hypothetical protein